MADSNDSSEGSGSGSGKGENDRSKTPQNVVELRPGKRSTIAVAKAERGKRAKGKTLCGRGFHRWKVAKERPFDVKQGKLVTLERCERCGKERTSSR